MRPWTLQSLVALSVVFAFAMPMRAHADEPTAAPEATPDAVPVDDRPVVTIDARAERLRIEQADAEGRIVNIDENAEVSDRTLAAEEADRPPPAGGTLTHRYQVGIRVGAGYGGVLGVRYKSGPDCGSTPGESFCYRAGVPFLDVDLSFGVSGSLEVTALGRIGLTVDDLSLTRPLMFGLGVRAYTPKDAVFKLFLGGRVYVDYQDSPRRGPRSARLRRARRHRFAGRFCPLFRHVFASRRRTSVRQQLLVPRRRVGGSADSFPLRHDRKTS